ncbi:hypothetical protein BAT02nite_38150 [Bacillus atrophaeus]|nr:hypothetical protein BAT02nite_38150 [Bacillus atrophaeus]
MPDIQNLISMANEIKGRYANFSVSEVNDHCLRLAVFTGEYDWHVHPESDELFIILEGEFVHRF